MMGYLIGIILVLRNTALFLFGGFQGGCKPPDGVRGRRPAKRLIMRKYLLTDFCERVLVNINALLR